MLYFKRSFSMIAYKRAALRLIKAFVALFLLSSFAFKAFGAEPVGPAKDGYDLKTVLKSIINPHEQINDEGYLLEGSCIICHNKVPDVVKDKGILKADLRSDDIMMLCYRCHVVKQHPGSDPAFKLSTGGMLAKSHLVVPSKVKSINMRLAEKDYPIMLPLDPKSGRLTCVTCHNPHERGVTIGRADFGADSKTRLRSANADLCVYCHRK